MLPRTKTGHKQSQSSWPILGAMVRTAQFKKPGFFQKPGFWTMDEYPYGKNGAPERNLLIWQGDRLWHELPNSRSRFLETIPSPWRKNAIIRLGGTQSELNIRAAFRCKKPGFWQKPGFWRAN